MPCRNLRRSHSANSAADRREERLERQLDSMTNRRNRPEPALEPFAATFRNAAEAIVALRRARVAPSHFRTDAVSSRTPPVTNAARTAAVSMYIPHREQAEQARVCRRSMTLRLMGI